MDDLDALLADLQNSSRSSGKSKPADDFPPPPSGNLTNGTVGKQEPGSTVQVSVTAVEALLNELDTQVSNSKSSAQTNGPPMPEPQHANATRTASTATKELDDLMASLSDFKVNTGEQPVNNRTPSVPEADETDAPPEKPAITSTTHTYHVSSNDDYAKVEKRPSQKSKPSTPQQNQQPNLDSMLGSLQTTMSKQGVATVTKGTCAGCNKPIIGQVCTALGKTWHPEHFSCCICDMELGTKTFFERDGKPYCENDYHEIFAPKCFACNGPILDSCVTSMDRTWHPEHFVCQECGRPFGDSGFHEKDGKAYCREDYFRLFAPKCSGCNKAIIENYISALNGHWHPHCFACMECHQPFQNGSFFEHEGMPYCEMHYHSRRGSLCYSCQKPITGRCITAMHRKFHPEHFICAFCLKQLNKGTFKEQNDKPYCHGCFVKLFG